MRLPAPASAYEEAVRALSEYRPRAANEDHHGFTALVRILGTLRELFDPGTRELRVASAMALENMGPAARGAAPALADALDDRRVGQGHARDRRHPDAGQDGPADVDPVDRVRRIRPRGRRERAEVRTGHEARGVCL